MIFIEILYNFYIRKIFNLLRLKDLNIIIIIKISINTIIIYSIIKFIIRAIQTLAVIIRTLFNIIYILAIQTPAIAKVFDK